MLRTLSPYNIITPYVSPATGVQCLSYKLQIWLFNGALAGVPIGELPLYEITKKNTGGSTGTDNVNISNIISDYIEQPLPVGSTIEFIDGNAMWWVYVRVIYTQPNSVAEPPAFLFSELYSRSYSYTMEGQNVVTVPNDILLNGREFKVSRSSVFLLPIYTPDNTVPTVTLDSFPSSEISLNPVSDPMLMQRKSAEGSQYLWIDCSLAPTDQYITVDVGGQEVVLLLTDEWKYEPIDIVFYNKYGHLQTLTFFKEFKKDLNVTNEQYKSSGGQPLAGKHQYVNFNSNGREGFKVQSGWQAEEMNDIFLQLLVSESVWSYSEGIYTPLTVESKALSFKTQKIDRLIQYEIYFKYAFDMINNI